MADGTIEATKLGYTVYFITVKPKVHFFSAGNKPTMVDLLKNNSSVKIISPEVDFCFEFGSEEYRALVYAKAIVSYLPKGIPIVISDDPSVWNAAALVSKRNPMIGVLHSDDQPYFDLANKYHNDVNLFVSVSSRIVKKCRSYATLKDLSIPVIPCGIVLPAYTPKTIIQNKKISMIWIGRMEEAQKRVSDLPKIALELKNRNIDFTFNIIGEGPEFGYLREQIKANGLQDEVFMLGWLDSTTIYQKLQGSNILILPSNYEGMPISVMEGLASGCSIVSSRVSGIEDYEKSSIAENCLRVYPIGNISNAVDKILELVSIPDETRRLAAISFANNEFSIQKSIEKYLSVIEKSIAGYSPCDYDPRLSCSKIFKSKLISILRYYKIKNLKYSS